MNGRRARRAWAALVLGGALLAPGCGGDDTTGPPAPKAGQLTVNIATSGAGGSAFLVTLRGEGITDPTAANSGHQIYSFAAGGSLRVAVIGTVSSGPLLRFRVPDLDKASGYSATLDEVAGADNVLQSPSGYTLTIAP